MCEPYKDKQKLDRLYHDEGLTQKQVADRLGCSTNTIIKYMDKLGVSTNDPNGSDPNAEYKDRDKLNQLYNNEGMTVDEVAEELGCEESTIRYWMDKHGLERKDKWAHTLDIPAHYRTGTSGYEQWQVRVNNDRHTVHVNRLAAVAWFGLDAVSGMETHHKNGISWDNREENIELLSKEDHARHHAKQTEFWKYRENVDNGVSNG